jgi:E1A/CREB-binding protein
MIKGLSSICFGGSLRQGDDYILYCHPQKQKTPRSDRLRAWYHDMLRKAKAEGLVAHVATLWDTYFPGGKDHRMERCSATHIPYLDGDYWPGEAENLLVTIGEGTRVAAAKGGAAQQARKGPAKGKRYGGGASTDEQLMSKLGEILGGNMKEDFMVVHLREPCSFCRCHVSGQGLHRYVPPHTGAALLKPPPERKFEGIKLESGGPSMPTGPLQHFQICDGCYGAEMARISSGQKGRLPAGLSLTDLTAEQLPPLQLEKDPDGNIDNEFFETRQAFLSLCQGNHYQFDSLRRAKHSSMMVLYHLHNPSAPAFAATCNNCSLEIEAGTGFRCTVCSDFDMCNTCKAKGFQHEHPMVVSGQQRVTIVNQVL